MNPSDFYQRLIAEIDDQGAKWLMTVVEFNYSKMYNKYDEFNKSGLGGP
jgi:hypothetical protein